MYFFTNSLKNFSVSKFSSSSSRTSIFSSLIVKEKTFKFVDIFSFIISLLFSLIILFLSSSSLFSMSFKLIHLLTIIKYKSSSNSYFLIDDCKLIINCLILSKSSFLSMHNMIPVIFLFNELLNILF